LVKRTKDAEAEAAYKTIGAEAEKKAAALRGEGLALFRRNIAAGMKDAASDLRQAGVDSSFLLFLEYTDALKYVADHAQGKVVFMDHGAGATERVAAQVSSLVGETGGGAPSGGGAGGAGGPSGAGGAGGHPGRSSQVGPSGSSGLPAAGPRPGA